MRILKLRPQQDTSGAVLDHYERPALKYLSAPDVDLKMNINFISMKVHPYLDRSRCFYLGISILLTGILSTVMAFRAECQSGTGKTADKKVTIYMDALSFNKKTFKLVRSAANPHAALALRNPKDSASGAVLKIILPRLQKGTYVFYSDAVRLPVNSGKAKQNNQYRASWGWNGARPSLRILYDPYNGGHQVVGKFDLQAGDNTLDIQLPPGIALASISYQQYIPPAVPPALLSYQPEIVPPAAHPRLWVTPSFLPVLRERLQSTEDSAAWHQVMHEALDRSDFNPDTTKELFFDESLEGKIRTKAFYFLVTEDSAVGEEAVRLLKTYYSVLSFGNVTYGDITREMGRAVYTGALVYDWCYPLISSPDRAAIRNRMLLLARDMEIGWPPYVDPIVNGHANEAQVSRDLLSMSIAVYNEDPVPYKYVSYALLKELIPMRAFEYKSSRHNQGVDYGAYRFGWEMHGAMLYYRMTGRKIYPDNIANMAYYWLNMRLPNGYMLRDGDMFSNKHHRPGDYYWKQPQTMLLCYAYMHDSLMKGEFLREGGLPDDPVLYLLLNDPSLRAEQSVESLPTTHDFGTVIGGMVARTGWDNRPASNDVVAEIRGGGYLFGNHQHSDAGAVQLYYHGMQFGDIGLYLSYGSAYDYNFNKRSIAHSMMLAYDPAEKNYFRAVANDGGTRFNQRFPVSPHQVKTDPWLNGGAVLATDQGPDFSRPYYSYFKAELAPAYAAKMSRYARSFCLVNPGDTSLPKILILADNMKVAKAGIQKYWQLNAYNTPAVSPDHILLHSQTAGITGYTRVEMVYPTTADRELIIKGGDSSRSVFGAYYPTDSSFAESKAYRLLFTPKKMSLQNNFVTVFQMAEDSTKVVPASFTAAGSAGLLRVADLLYVVSLTGHSIMDSVYLDATGSNKVADTLKLLATDLEPGFWHLVSLDGVAKGTSINFYVRPEKNTLYTSLMPGRYVLVAGRDYRGEYTAPENGRPYHLEYTPVAAPPASDML